MSVSPFGVHRVVQPKSALPYHAERLDTSLPIHEGEILVEVEALNVDSASFTQLAQETERDADRLRARIGEIVRERGKMHNPVTGSGGVLIGRVRDAKGRDDVAVGDRLVTLISLTTTPLELQEVGHVNWATHQVQVQGHAILFAKSPFAKVPSDLPEPLAMAVLDVCGAPAQTARLVKPGMRVVILGAAGKSGLLCSAVAAGNVGQEGQVIALVASEAEAKRVNRLPFPLTVLVGDARDPVRTYQQVGEATKGTWADLVINCVNVPNTEMASILSARNRGTVYFFSMATSFQAAALGAESVGQDVDLLIGNGYAEGHADYALEVVRRHPELRAVLEEMQR